MINIKYWNESFLKNNEKLQQLLNESFKVKTSDLNYVHNKTILISIIKNNQIIGTISLISNEHLIEYLKSKKKDIETLSSIYSFKADKGAYIYNLAVDKNYRGLGLGKKLVNTAIYIAKLKKIKYVHVHCDNEISVNIFKNKKFSIENVFKNNKNVTMKLMTSWL